MATLLGAKCCVHLATLLRSVATCWVLLAQTWPFSNLSQQHPTCCICTQHVAPNNVGICWVDMLRSFGRGFNLLALYTEYIFTKRTSWTLVKIFWIKFKQPFYSLRKTLFNLSWNHFTRRTKFVSCITCKLTVFLSWWLIPATNSCLSPSKFFWINKYTLCLSAITFPFFS